ncbi:MAG: cytochrome b/b6 domain-containing protein [Halodesulfurarchaeum sp.]
MDWKRPLIAIGIAVAVIAGYLVASDASQLYLWQAFESGSYTFDILFSSWAWLLPAAVSVGLLAGAARATTATGEAETARGKVKRHTAFGGFLEHWTLAAGMITLMLSGIWLGFLFVPQLATGTESIGLAMNVHWLGTIIILFVIAYHVGGLIMGDHRELVPTGSDFGAAVRDIGHYLGLNEQPPAGKYKPIQRVSYLVWAGIIGVLSLTGLVKAADYVWAVGGGLKSAMTGLHEVFALLAILMFVGHVGIVFLPSHLQLLRSQVTGWIPERYAREHHPEWLPTTRSDGGKEDD